MSFEAIKTELRALTLEERRKLMACLVVLEDQAQAKYATKLAQRIDDPTQGRWLTAEQCEAELGHSNERNEQLSAAHRD
jgi:ATP-dependent DNA ligase